MSPPVTAQPRSHPLQMLLLLTPQCPLTTPKCPQAMKLLPVTKLRQAMKLRLVMKLLPVMKLLLKLRKQVLVSPGFA
jgi:hypothetical protein